MNPIWKREYILRTSDFDKYSRIKPSAVLDLFQDAAGLHAEELSVGSKEMTELSYLWVLTRTKFKIVSNPENHQKVIVKTWPLKPGRLVHRRECSIEDESGNPIIVGSSEWVVISGEMRRPIAAPEIYSLKGDFCEEMMFAEKLGKVSDFEATGIPYTINAGFSEIDINNHVNNTKYANFVLDAISPSDTDILETLQIDYRKEVLEGTRLNVFHKKEDSEVLAKGLNDDGETMFACKLEFKSK